ncbi:MAG: methionyl-tRNA formyltransferase [Fimbriimonadia bacterium]|jgi:methionyl-tRNA formyltransferase
MRVLYFGTAPFAVPALRAIANSNHDLIGVVSQPDSPSGRGMRLRPSAVTETATELGIEALRPESCRSEEFLRLVTGLRPDVLVVAAYGQIMPVTLLEAAPLGGINIHASLLPRWRGAAPIPRAIEHGDAVTGITIMLMDAGMDTGDILLQEETPIGEDENAGQLTERLAVMGAHLIVQALDLLPDGLTRTPQDSALATKAPKVKKEEGLLDWALSARTLHNRVRAFTPQPGAHTTYQTSSVKVCATKLIDSFVSAEPGSVVAVGPDGIGVACGDGALLLTEIQPEAKRRMTALDFSNGYGVRPGTRFGT